jgi:hypothetical protein
MPGIQAKSGCYAIGHPSSLPTYNFAMGNKKVTLQKNNLPGIKGYDLFLKKIEPKIHTDLSRSLQMLLKSPVVVAFNKFPRLPCPPNLNFFDNSKIK